jgi:chloramphenicol-sensitive protein RarD
MNISQKSESRKLTGYFTALTSYTMWGFLPFYWKTLHHVPSLQIMLNRIIWCFVFLLIISAFRKRNCFKLINSFKIFASVLITGLVLSTNWFAYIYCVNTDRIIEASLGYYINPLVSIALGMIFFKERLNKLQIAALVFAAGGVLYMTLDYGQFPFIALYLAVSFGTYGCLKKFFSFDSIDGLMAETFSVVPIAVIIMMVIGFKGESSLFSGSLRTDILIMFSGVATGIPLLFFAEAAKRIPLSAMGFLQYIAPTLMLLTGIFYYKEPFLRAHMIGFSLIWTGLLIYSYSVIKGLRNNR